MAFEAYMLGQVIHGERVKQGYKTAADFSEAIENTTGILIPKDTIQRIEAGRQEPKISQYIGIAITLRLLNDRLLLESLPPDLMEYRNAHLKAGRRISERLVDDDGTVYERLVDGTVRMTSPDGSIREKDPDGSIWESF